MFKKKQKPFGLRPYIKLDRSGCIGQGHQRECHVHPQNSQLCIKVPRHDEQGTAKDQNSVEWRTFVNLKRRGVPLQHVAYCYDWVDTNHGPGLVCERVLNMDGSWARTLEEEVSVGTITLEQLDEAAQNLKDWSWTNAVVVADLRGSNLMVRHVDNGIQLVFIDGLGGRKLDQTFALRQKIAWLGRRKTRRQWRQQWPDKYDQLKRWLA